MRASRRSPLKLGAGTLLDLEDNLLLFFTGQHRSASSILKDQDMRTRDSDAEMICQSPRDQGTGGAEQEGPGGRRRAPSSES